MSKMTRTALLRFRDRCPHVKEQWVRENGGRVNLDLMARVLLARRVLTATTVQRGAVQLIPNLRRPEVA